MITTSGHWTAYDEIEYGEDYITNFAYYIACVPYNPNREIIRDENDIIQGDFDYTLENIGKTHADNAIEVAEKDAIVELTRNHNLSFANLLVVDVDLDCIVAEMTVERVGE